MRQAYDDTIKYVFVSNDVEAKDYMFYVHLLQQCRLELNDKLQYIAGVSFSNLKYNLHINPIMFKELSIIHRLGVLKHEMLHIVDLHLTLRKKEDNKNWNLATDCSINQLIKKHYLPDGCITIDSLFDTSVIKVLPKQNAEYYYDLIQNNPDAVKYKGQFDNIESSSDSESDEEAKFSSETLKEFTRAMIETAIEETKKVGNIPAEISEILKLKYSKEVNWKKELQKIMSSVNYSKTRTITKPNRRNPNRKDLYGNKKDKKQEILVITDESGSVSNKAEQKALSEILNLCSIFSLDVDLIRVDTEASEPIKLNKKSIQYNRIKSGGTYLSSAIEKIKKYYDLIIILTDGELSDKDIKNFTNLDKEIIWLVINKEITSSKLENKKMKKIQLTDIIKD